MSPELWFIYIAQCKDNTLYIGISNNVAKRIDKHNSGKGAQYTKGRTPITLLYQEKFENKSAASKREIELKSWSRQKKEQLIMNHALLLNHKLD
jgi:putative endonuclease